MVLMSSEQRDFNADAATWDENPARVKLAHDIARVLLASGILKPDKDVLDAGCGTGLLTLLLQPSVHSITGSDSSEGMLGVLDAKIRNRLLKNVKTCLVDFENRDAIGGHYDVVVSSMTLHHIRDIPALLVQCAAVLKPGGVLCIADLDKDDGKFHDSNDGVFHPGFDRAVLTKKFEDAGFYPVRNRTAAIIRKADAAGNIRCFTVFLITGWIRDDGEGLNG
jgi:ubiquinone/menaquinone biosynthesis C-methylase UbiE